MIYDRGRVRDCWLLAFLICVAPLGLSAQQTPPTSSFDVPPGVRVASDVTFRIQGSHTIRLDLLLPVQTSHVPAIVIVGGDTGPTRSGQLGRYAAQLAGSGFAVAIIDYKPRVVGTRMAMSAAVSDAKLAVRWLRAHSDSFGIDRARIGMLGAGESALVAALAGLPNWFGVGSNDNVRFPSEVGALALLEPVLDLADTTLSAAAQSFLNSVLTPGATGRVGGLEIDLPYRERISPANYFGGGATRDVREHVPPMLLLHGTADSLFPFRHSRQFADVFSAQGINVELFVAEGAAHGFFDAVGWQKPALDALTDFFRRSLSGAVYDAGWVDATPVWSPRGDRIAFHSTYGGEWGIWVMGIDGSDLRHVAAGREPTWSPDGSRLAFESGEGRLASIDIDGTNFSFLTRDTTEFVYATSWSPDGRHIAFSSWVDNQLYVLRLSDGTVQRLPASRGGNGCSSWYPDAMRIAFHSYRDGQADLYAMSLGDTTDVRLTASAAHEFCPRVSPDGTRIVFQRRASQVHERIDLIVMPLDKSGDHNITDHPANDRYASWSPDGEWIAFASTRGGNSDIYIVRPDGTDLRRLTRR